jgi:hypothetical protein
MAMVKFPEQMRKRSRFAEGPATDGKYSNLAPVLPVFRLV